MRAIAGLALSNAFGIEILDIDEDSVTWRWSNEKKERVSKIKDGAFRAGRTWYRLGMFGRYGGYSKIGKEG